MPPFGGLLLLKGSDLPSAVSVLTEWILQEELQVSLKGHLESYHPTNQPSICPDSSVFQRESKGCESHQVGRRRFKARGRISRFTFLPASLLCRFMRARLDDWPLLLSLTSTKD